MVKPIGTPGAWKRSWSSSSEAGGAENTEDFTRGDFEINVVDRQQVTVTVGQVFDDY
jgi:hypothetical protein